MNIDMTRDYGEEEETRIQILFEGKSNSMPCTVRINIDANERFNLRCIIPAI